MTTKIGTIFIGSLIVVSLFLCACQRQSNLDGGGGLTPFQSQAQATLRKLAANVSQARRAGGSGTSRRGIGSLENNSLYGDYIIKKAMAEEVKDCVSYVKYFPITSQHYLPMVATLTQCLDRLLTYRNPVLTFAFRNLDPESQQYWAYLLNWRRQGSLGEFGGNDFQTNSQFAKQGYMDNDE